MTFIDVSGKTLLNIEGWQAQPLGDLISLEYGASLSEANRVDGEYPVYGSNGQISKHATFLVRGPGIIVGRKGTAGAVIWSDNSFWPIDTTYYVNPHKNHDLRWCYWQLLSLPIARMDSSTGVPGLNRNDVYKLWLNVPSPSEQSFIAHVLDTLDTQIQQTEKLVAKLKQIKIGLLHDLLTRGIDEHGDVRDPVVHPEEFKKSPLGRIPKEWEVCPIEDKLYRIIDYRGKTPHKANTGIPLITARNVKEGFLDLSSTEYIKESDYDEWMNRGIPSRGDVLFTTEAPLGNVAQIPDYRVALSQRILTLCANSEVLDKNFLLWLLLWENTQKLFKEKSTGSTVVGIKQSVFRKVRLQFPPLEEQKAISKVLDQHMIHLQLEEELLAKLKQIKKGLMHDLLSGRIRVTQLIAESEQL